MARLRAFGLDSPRKTANKQDAKDAEDEHRRALRLGEIHPRDPWPKPTCERPAHLPRVRKGIPAICQDAHEAGDAHVLRWLPGEASGIRCHRRCPAKRDYRRSGEQVRPS